MPPRAPAHRRRGIRAWGEESTLTDGAAISEREESRDDPRYLGHDLIFLISQPRSGSTLLQRMLAGHSWIQTSAETWLMLHPAYGLRHQGIQTDYRAGWAVAYVRYSEDYVADERWARENRKGIWAEEYDGVEMPWDFRSRSHGSR